MPKGALGRFREEGGVSDHDETQPPTRVPWGKLTIPLPGLSGNKPEHRSGTGGCDSRFSASAKYPAPNTSEYLPKLQQASGAYL